MHWVKGEEHKTYVPIVCGVSDITHTPSSPFLDAFIQSCPRNMTILEKGSLIEQNKQKVIM
jgi:hypothetical protein